MGKKRKRTMTKKMSEREFLERWRWFFDESYSTW